MRKRITSILTAITLFLYSFLSIPLSAIAYSSFTTSASGVELIKSFEGCRLTAYKALSSETYWTIGYGHNGSDVYQGMTITQSEAEALLKQDLVKYETFVNNFLNRYSITINQNQFDALTSFTYNLGNVWVQSDDFKLRTYLINGIGNYSESEITTAFTNWSKSGGVTIQGLFNRRKAEAELFLNGGINSCDCSDIYTGNYICTTQNYPLTIRSGHGTNYAAIGSIPSGATVYVSKADGTWAHISYDGVEGYASMEYLEIVPTPPDKPTVFINGTDNCAIGSGNSITYTFNAPNSTSVHLYIYKGSDKIFGGEYAPNGSYSKSFTEPGHYSCYIVSHNASGSTESDWKGWDVAARPAKPVLQHWGTSTKDYQYFTWDRTNGTTWYDLRIYDSNGNCIKYIPQIYDNYYSINLGEGSYSAGLCSVLEGYYECWTESDHISFSVVSEPIASLVKTVEFNNHKYELYQSRLTWDEAEYYCENYRDGHLATITSQEEQDFIQNNLLNNNLTGYFLGGSDKEKEGNWQWITGESFNYTNWTEGQPDNYTGNNSSGECYLEIYSSNGKWNDYYYNAYSKGFICEIEAKLPVLQSITITELPNKTEYHIGEEFDSTGLKLKLTYSDGSSESAIDGFSISGFDSSVAGRKTITVTYSAFKTTFEVIIIEQRITGDVDGDGEITDWDSILLNRYLAGWSNVEINLSVADVDGDCEVNDWDAIILERYLAGWDIQIS